MSRAWDVYTNETCEHTGLINRTLIDTVFYDDNCDEDWVRDGLVNHDGYPPDIELETEELEECPCCDVKSFMDTWKHNEEDDIPMCPDCIETITELRQEELV